MFSKRRLTLMVIAVAVTCFFLWLFGRKLVENWPHARDAFAAVITSGSWVWLIPATAMMFLVFLLTGWRWQIIMRPLARPGYWPLFSATSIGFMLNCILPLRLGELARAAVLAARRGRSRLSDNGRVGRRDIGIGAALATIVVERLFDLLGIVTISAVGLLWLVWGTSAPIGESHSVRLLTIFMAAMALLCIAFLAFMFFRPHWARGIVMACARCVPAAGRAAVMKVLDSFMDGLGAIRTVRQGLIVLALSMLHWAMMGMMVYLTSLCFADQTFAGAGGAARFDIGVPGAFVIQAFQAVAVSLPQAPGFLGTHQAATLETARLILGDDSTGIAGAYAIVLWGVSVLPVILLGFICLWAEGLSIGQVRDLARRGENDGDQPGGSSDSSAPTDG